MKPMKKIVAPYVMVMLILLAGCQEPAGRPPVPLQTEESPTSPALPTESTASPAEEAAAAEPTSQATAVKAASTATPAPTSDSQNAAAAQTAPSLFVDTWDDRDIFLSGLAPAEAGILNELPGATIYHLALDITNPLMVDGTMEARYTNQEEVALADLVLHLFPEKLGGAMEVSNIRIDGETASWQVDNGSLRVALDSPLGPGEQVVLSMDFLTTVPGDESTKYKVLAYAEEILALAHFYPMFAVYDDQGWHTEPSAEHGDETFADTSFYVVQVTAPVDQVIAAGGVELNRQEEAGQQRVTYAAGPMRDFYLASSATFDVVQQQLGPVMINSYAPAGRIEGAQYALEVAAEAMDSFAARYGPYPYSELDIVSTPTDALGIEYPGIFANALRIYDLSGSSASSGITNSVLLESTTAHETGHQWFYSLVGSDQLNEPWLDEALTQYATWQYFIDRYGEQNGQGFFDNLQGRWERAEEPDTPIGLPADAYSGRDYGAIVYGRGPIFLNELAEMMGQETFDAFLRDYSETYRWQIASAAEFMELAEQHCDCDLSELFAEQVFGN